MKEYNEAYATARAERWAFLEERRNKEDDLKIMVVINAPKRFVGRKYRDGQMEPVATPVRTAMETMKGCVDFGIVAQSKTKEVKMDKNSLNLFINPPVDRPDPYEDLRVNLHRMKFLPVKETSYHTEFTVAFMPPSTTAKIGIRGCCFRTPQVCDADMRGGVCQFKTEQLMKMGYARSIFQAPGQTANSERRDDAKKRKRKEQAASARAAMDKQRALRVAFAMGRLCQMYQRGQVCTVYLNTTWIMHHAQHAHEVCQRKGVQRGTRRPLGEEAHNVCHIVAMSLVGKRIAMIGPTTSAEESYFGCIPAPNASNRIKPHHTEEQEKDRKGGRGRGGDLAQ